MDMCEANKYILEGLRSRREILWINPNQLPIEAREEYKGFNMIYIQAAQNRFMRFLPYVASAFPETAGKKGVIESPLLEIKAMKEAMGQQGISLTGRLFLKDDARMPIAGSVKARGGIHEVMKIAETVAMKEGFMLPADNHAILDTDEAKEIFGKYTIQVGSTGNLGISIGRMASRLGFKAIVHMSCDAREWKKNLLRSEGVIVKEYSGDYSQAVAQGRADSASDPMSYFVDDENSKDLFFGYATAPLRLKMQLNKARVPVDEKHPLFVYLPCGVGGAPSGITFGLKQLFGENVHCFFAEPVEAPCFTLGMASGKHAEISVQNIGLTGKTIADGLAVGRPSAFACDMMDGLMAGAFTVTDEKLSKYQKLLKESESIYVEPSAAIGFGCLEAAFGNEATNPIQRNYEQYLADHELTELMADATHVVWATGGGLEPQN